MKCKIQLNLEFVPYVGIGIGYKHGTVAIMIPFVLLEIECR